MGKRDRYPRNPRPGRQPGPRGRADGQVLTLRAREAIELAFEGIGGLPALIEWAQHNPDEFYTKLYIRLLPVHMHMENADAGNIRVDDARHRLAQLFAGLADAAAKKKTPQIINGRAERPTDT